MLGLLASAGLSFLENMVLEKGEDVVNEVVKKTTGIDLIKKDNLSKQEIAKITSAKVDIEKEIFKDRANARSMNIELSKSDSWLLKNTGSLIGIFTVICSFFLFGLLLGGNLDIKNSNVAMIVGFAGGYVTQILSFYFGSSKNRQ